jgi:hypothetical protein
LEAGKGSLGLAPHGKVNGVEMRIRALLVQAAQFSSGLREDMDLVVGIIIIILIIGTRVGPSIHHKYNNL